MKLPMTLLCMALLSGCTEKQIDNAGNALASTAPSFANDALIVAQIESSYVSLDADSALHVAVSSNDGVVKLTGRVKSGAVRDHFIEAAKKTQNVKHVDASLTIDGSLPGTKEQVADFALGAAVQANVAGQSGVNALSVHVAAHDGVVTLGGTVPTEALRSTIVSAAKSVTGVKSVVDTLKVRT